MGVRRGGTSVQVCSRQLHIIQNVIGKSKEPEDKESEGRVSSAWWAKAAAAEVQMADRRGRGRQPQQQAKPVAKRKPVFETVNSLQPGQSTGHNLVVKVRAGSNRH